MTKEKESLEAGHKQMLDKFNICKRELQLSKQKVTRLEEENAKLVKELTDLKQDKNIQQINETAEEIQAFEVSYLDYELEDKPAPLKSKVNEGECIYKLIHLLSHMLVSGSFYLI